MKRKIWKRKVEIHKMEWLYPYVRLEDFMFVVKQLEEENRKLKETIKDHQLYEEKLEHRIIEFEELLHWE